MGRKNVTNRTKAQNKLAEFSTKTRRREAFRRGIRLLFATGAIALAFVASPAFAQTSDSQLTIDANKKASTIDDNVTSVVFNGAYSLTLINGQTLRPVFLSREPGAKLILGDTAKAQTWTISGNSPSWNGELSLMEGHTLSVAVPPIPWGRIRRRTRVLLRRRPSTRERRWILRRSRPRTGRLCRAKRRLGA